MATVEEFYDQPEFTIDTDLKTSFPDHEEWCSCVDDFGFLISQLKNRSMVYTMSKVRYLRLSPIRLNLLEDADMRNSFCLLYAEALFWLGDNVGSLTHLQTLKQSLPDDVKLNDLIDKLELICVSVEAEELSLESVAFDEEEQLAIHHLRDPEPCPRHDIADDTEEVFNAWMKCKSEIGETEALDIFTRFAAVTTNELESVFEVDESTWHRLVRKGFFENSIAGIPRGSKIQSASRIINILKQTNRCIDGVGAVLDDDNRYNSEFICTLHAHLMEGENFETEYDENHSVCCIQLILAGEQVSR